MNSFVTLEQLNQWEKRLMCLRQLGPKHLPGSRRDVAQTRALDGDVAGNNYR